MSDTYHIRKRYSSILPLHRCSDWSYELRAIIYNFLALFQYSCIPLHNYDASVCRCSLRNAAGRFSTYATERVEKTRLIDVKIDSLTCLTLFVFYHDMSKSERFLYCIFLWNVAIQLVFALFGRVTATINFLH